MPSSTTSQSTRLRHVVIGIGAKVMSSHRSALALADVELVGATDLDPVKGQDRADEFGCPFYGDPTDLLSATDPDVAVITTPHPAHADVAIQALEAGSHVILEKPIASTVGDADRIVAAADAAERHVAVCYQNRFRPVMRAAKRLLTEGALGSIQHVSLRAVAPRTAAYYRLGSWRGTWQGEGGGVILNQAPHALDLLVALLGPANRVTAWNRTQLEPIETEDTVDALVGWPHGTVGNLHVSVAEVTQPERIELVGTRGTLLLTPDAIRMEVFDDIIEMVQNDPRTMPNPKGSAVDVRIDEGRGDHRAVYTDMHRAIRSGSSPEVHAREALHSLEMANGIIQSGYVSEEVSLPLDRERYAKALQGLINRSAVNSAHPHPPVRTQPAAPPG